jgi:hypothetical protein
VAGREITSQENVAAGRRDVGFISATYGPLTNSVIP